MKREASRGSHEVGCQRVTARESCSAAAGSSPRLLPDSCRRGVVAYPRHMARASRELDSGPLGWPSVRAHGQSSSGTRTGQRRTVLYCVSPCGPPRRSHGYDKTAQRSTTGSLHERRDEHADTFSSRECDAKSDEAIVRSARESPLGPSRVEPPHLDARGAALVVVQ